jgi:hypothetical protein
MPTLTHDQCGGAVDISHKPITCKKCGKVAHAAMTKDDGQNIILWSQEEYREQLKRRQGQKPNGSKITLN